MIPSDLQSSKKPRTHREILLTSLKDCRSWLELKKRLCDSSTNPSVAGKSFEVFCKYYFLSEPTVKDDYRNVWLYEEIPQPVKEKLNLGSVEHGVDLILEDKESKYTAVQCKFRGDESDGLSWSKDKIANLFGFAIKAGRFAVFTNASELDHVSKERTKQFTFYNISDLLHIDATTFAAIEKLLVGEAPPQVKKFIPHDHQQRAIDAALKHFKTESRGQLIFPCGAGKTVTALWIKEKLGATSTLVLVPSLALLRQIKNDWVKQRTGSYKYMRCSSSGSQLVMHR